MHRLWLSLAGLLVLLLVAIAILAVLAWWSRRQEPTLGLVDGRLAACVSNDRCYSTDGEAKSGFRFVDDPTVAWQRFQQVLTASSGVTIERVDGYYLHATARTALFGFVDDVEASVDLDQQVIHVRSVSRVGKSDLGANRARVERWLGLWQDAQ